MSGKLFDMIFNLKFTAKQFNRQALKAEKDEKSEKLKAKKAMEKNNREGAQIYAQNAIRLKNDQLTYLRLASRLDGVVSRLEQQSKMGMVTKNMAGIVKNLEKQVNSAQLEKVSQTMDEFEKVFDNLDVQSSTLESAMAGQMATTTPQSEVDGLLAQIAEEHGLETNMALPSAGQKTAQPAAAEPAVEDDLAARLNALRGA